jgi:hypothetical protein
VGYRESNGDIYYYSASPSSGYGSNGGTVSVTFRLYKVCYGSVCKTESVNGSTPILLANGTYEFASNITVGTLVMGYNASTGSFFYDSVAGVNVDTHSRVVIINGYLDVTYNQTVWTNHGYMTAGNLTAGDLVLNVYTGSYVKIHSIRVEYGSFTFYDLELSGGNNFIAWAYLLGTDY